MKKFIKRATAAVLAMAMAFSFSAIGQADAKTTNPVKKIKVTNSDDFVDIQAGDTIKVKYKITYSDGLSKKEKSKASGVTFSSKDKKIATVNSKGVVKAVAPGKTKITVTSKANKQVKAGFTVEVETEYDMVFKYSNLYFVLPEGASFPYTIKLGDKDALGHEFNIKTNFGGKFVDFDYSVFNEEDEDATTAKASVDAGSASITVTDYGCSDVECSYKKEEEVGDSFNLYVLTQAQFDAMKAEGEISDEKENVLGASDSDDDEPDDPNEVEDTDESEDEED